MRKSTVVLGQCHFTYRVVRNLIDRGYFPEYVCIARADADSDPFKGLKRQTLGVSDWLHVHRQYHDVWRTEVRQLCHSHGISFLDVDFPVKDLPTGDTLIVSAYAQKLPACILEGYPRGALNIHPSLLPDYRGPQPEAQVILNGDIVSGVTLHVMTPEFDRGPIVAQHVYDVPNDADVAGMEEIEAAIAAELIVKVGPMFLEQASAQPPGGRYYKAYPITALDLGQVPDVLAAKRLMRLRPEGYAYFTEGQCTLYPIEIGTENRSHARRIGLASTAECYAYRWVEVVGGHMVEKILGKELAFRLR